MIESKKEVTTQVNIVLGLLEPLARGDVLEHTVIELALNLPRWNSRYRTVMDRVMRAHLDNRGITLWGSAAIGVGYRLLTAEEQLHCLSVRGFKAKRQYHRGIREVSALPPGELTDFQQAVRSRDLDSARDRVRSIQEDERIRSVLLRPHECNPRPIYLRKGRRSNDEHID